MSTPAIKFNNVGLAYKRTLNLFSNKTWVMRNVTFDIKHGEVLGIIGNNGAGKSTLLRLLADIVSPNEGSILRERGLKSQLLTLNLGFNANLNGFDNVIMSLVVQGKSIKEAKALVAPIQEYSELGDLLKYPVSTYSSGQRARLGFAIAIHSKPDVLLLDEMLGVGDRSFQAKSAKELRRIVTSDQTAVLVSHNTNVLQQFCKRTLWLDNGTIRSIGDTEKVLEEYNK